ncbi:acyltransferase [Amycolatopsis acidiphila]|uniref:Acyltransferase n=1 Tax=Amycolatopsis acidiphila TaxID=715473 RepID=A0A558A4L6_9PSEU|nr:nitrilase-related carbon-nitrogen hydrolase [Amycolatopsis acidiphila]TVT19209.1 acyltransferase [Amycolatopsis acidiphila]UIJ62029.1 acyltransferase [Amycolatopsis acidiphila]GHG56561.1 apolipoprotein N-acyltransferase [Amycolatopsis acidiphila]
MERLGTTRDHRLLTAAALVSSAVLGYLGTGLAPVAALTWLAPLPVLLLAPRVRVGTALAVAFGACLLGTANSWGFQLHSHDEPMVPVGLVINLGTSLTFVATVWVFRALAVRGRTPLAAIAAPAAWTGMFYVVSIANPQGLMGTFANDQGDVPLVLQVAAVGGMWAVEFMVMFAPCTVAALLSPGVSTMVRLRTATVAVVVFVAALGFGALRLAGTGGAPQRVAAIAPDRYAWAPAVTDGLVADYVHEIENLPDGVRTVVLPEGAFGSGEAEPAVLVRPMRQAARARGVDIVLGLIQTGGRGPANLALLFPADGGDPLRYLKQHDLVSAHGHELVFSPTTRTGVEICADLDFARPSRDYGAAGSTLLAIPASDNDENGWQHNRTALLRGVENGIPVAWSDQNGTLLISDGWGRVLAQAHTGGPARFSTVTADVTGPGTTVYSRLGDWFAWLCLVVAVGGLVACLPIARRQASGAKPVERAE